MSRGYVHGYAPRENERLQDQARSLVELLHWDTSYPAGSKVLEAGCGIGAQTLTLARNSPQARITCCDLSAASLGEAKTRAEAAGLTNVHFERADVFGLPHALEAGLMDPELFDRGIRDLYATAGPNGVFCYTFFKAVAVRGAA